MIKYFVIKSETLSAPYEPRFVCVDEEGNVLDDAQGYGYRSPQAAHASFQYKNRDKCKDAEKRKKSRIIKQWCSEHRDFVNTLDIASLEIAKGQWPGVDFNTKLVRDLLTQSGIEIDELPFKPSELLRYYLKH